MEPEMPANQLVLGTHNKKKGIELDELLRPHGLTVLTLREFENPLHVIEDGDSFAANARKKAVEQARHLDQAFYQNYGRDLLRRCFDPLVS